MKYLVCTYFMFHKLNVGRANKLYIHSAMQNVQFKNSQNYCYTVLPFHLYLCATLKMRNSKRKILIHPQGKTEIIRPRRKYSSLCVPLRGIPRALFQINNISKFHRRNSTAIKLYYSQTFRLKIV